MIYQLIVMLSKTYSITLIFKVLEISKSSFYTWQRKESYQLSAVKVAKSAQVKEVFQEHRRRYGARRIVAELQEQGVKIGRHQVRSLMKQQDLVAIQPKSFVPKTTNSTHGLGRSPNLLLNEDGTYRKPTMPYEIFVSDITYLPLASGGFLYLATFQDMYTRVIVGWELMDSMNIQLTINALQKSINRYSLPKGLIIHSDGGGQYAGNRFKQLLSAHDFLSSMTRRDNHYDMPWAKVCSPDLRQSCYKRVLSRILRTLIPKLLSLLNCITTKNGDIRKLTMIFPKDLKKGFGKIRKIANFELLNDTAARRVLHKINSLRRLKKKKVF